MSLIKPRTLKGFPDYPPAEMIPREAMMETARRVYRSYGFAPIDTPAVELAGVLLAKLSSDAEISRQLYRFQTPGRDDVVLRFDLTVPLARFAAQHVGPNPGQLPIPFKRYHLGTVWRGENTQAGRYREFMQCDFDTVGTTSNAADIEIALVIHDLMVALGLESYSRPGDAASQIERFEIRLNNRLVLNGLLESVGVADKAETVMRTLDKLGKAGREKVRDEMVQVAAITPDQADRVIALTELQGDNEEILAKVERDFGTNSKTADGIAKLRELLTAVKISGIPDGRLRVDLSICRGLDYYTGTIYETFLVGTCPDDGGVRRLESFGSICSGGRYDNLTALYTKTPLPGVGASLGLDRLLAIKKALGMFPATSTMAPVLVINFVPERIGDYHRIARRLRAAGIGVEVYSESKKIGAQLQYAERRGFSLAVIAGPDELASGTWKVKDLAARDEIVVTEADLCERIRQKLAGVDNTRRT
jgi:histidyl-tRNA synthetase